MVAKGEVEVECTVRIFSGAKADGLEQGELGLARDVAGPGDLLMEGGVGSSRAKVKGLGGSGGRSKPSGKSVEELPSEEAWRLRP